MKASKNNPRNLRKQKRKTQPTQPIEIVPKIQIKHTFRLTATTATTPAAPVTFTFTDLFGLLAINIVAATSGVSILSAVRLKRIDIWGTGPPVAAQASTVSLEIDNTTNNTGIGIDPVSLINTSYSQVSFAKIRFVPGKLTPHGMWQNSGTTAGDSGSGLQIKVSANIGDTMDITILARLATRDPQLAIASASTSAVLGNLGGFGIPTATALWTQQFIPFP